MINKFTKAVASIMLSSAMIIPASVPIIAETPSQAENMTAETFINTYLSKTVVKDNITTYEPFKTVDDSNYEQILSGESVYANLTKELQDEIDKQVQVNTGMNYESLLNTAKEKKQALEDAKKQEQENQEQKETQTDNPVVTETQTSTQTQSNATAVPAQTQVQPVQQEINQSQSTNQTSQTADTTQTSTLAPAGITYTRMASTASGIHVNAAYTGDTFNEDVNLVVSDVAKTANSYSVDISFQKADGTEVEPNAGKSVSISISYPSLTGSEFEVIHTDENQNNADIQVSSVNATSAAFSASTFSVFTVQAKVQAAPVQNVSTESEQKTEPVQENPTNEKVNVQEVKTNEVAAAGETAKNEKAVSTESNTDVKSQKVDVKKATDDVNTSNARVAAYKTIVSDTKLNASDDSDIDEQAQAFVMTYLTSATGVVYQRANANNYQTILNSGNAWNQLNINVRRRVNQILTSEIGKTYLKLLNEAKQMANASPSTGIETNVISYSVMLGTSILGVISVRKKKSKMNA